jgi:carbonic anhydrase/acetyltransferase-like protein (isoleucine patch superfamily)
MGATLLDGVVMEPGSIVAAGAVVPPGETSPNAVGCILEPLTTDKLQLSVYV